MAIENETPIVYNVAQNESFLTVLQMQYRLDSLSVQKCEFPFC